MGIEEETYLDKYKPILMPIIIIGALLIPVGIVLLFIFGSIAFGFIVTFGLVFVTASIWQKSNLALIIPLIIFLAQEKISRKTQVYEIYFKTLDELLKDFQVVQGDPEVILGSEVYAELCKIHPKGKLTSMPESIDKLYEQVDKYDPKNGNFLFPGCATKVNQLLTLEELRRNSFTVLPSEELNEWRKLELLRIRLSTTSKVSLVVVLLISTYLGFKSALEIF